MNQSPVFQRVLATRVFLPAKYASRKLFVGIAVLRKSHDLFA